MIRLARKRADKGLEGLPAETLAAIHRQQVELAPTIAEVGAQPPPGFEQPEPMQEDVPDIRITETPVLSRIVATPTQTAVLQALAQLESSEEGQLVVTLEEDGHMGIELRNVQVTKWEVGA